ncbi:hypothetical protein HDF16_004891 [Granulicella aggregans]|uniref:Uncharacterized protein n=1 Tax=Granulicella aggregans TaxID=474949 RepID=A0A7W8E7E1_9BACT|nr:hypothetical protein [Granulicella aggregans]MBB5060155.1 hypothetical protein [Granulicella aggregans]
MTAQAYSTFTSRLIALWFVIAFSASALHWIKTPPTVPPLPLGIAAGLPLIVFGVWYASSRTFRDFCMGLDRSVLTMIQSWRVAGFVFLVLYTHQILPGMFALPAGWGDISIGATAPFVARNWGRRAHKVGFVLWQALGAIDLFTAVGLGSTVSLMHSEGVPTSAMTVLPMSLIPTFAVPLLLIFHFICIAQVYTQPVSERLLFDRATESMRSC